MIELRGITWDHPRGVAPLLATASAFSGIHANVEIQWRTRSLAAFGEQSIERLAPSYDLLVIDHPFVGTAARTRCLLPLDEYLPAKFLEEQRLQSVGPSYGSYTYDGHQWAVAVDVAAHVSAHRADLLKPSKSTVPRTWDAVFELAARVPVAMPLNPIGCIDSFLTLCANIGEQPGRQKDYLVSRKTAASALSFLRKLVPLVLEDSFVFDPPRLLDRMSTTDEIAYCPLLFGYSNYARTGGAQSVCHFTNIPGATKTSGSRGALLGGAGLALSASCKAIDSACEYLRWVSGPDCQTSLYFDSGGQPGNRLAWLNARVNAAANSFFLDTLETLDGAYVRPRYHGFVPIHDRAGLLIHQHLRNRTNEEEVLNQIDALYLNGG